VKTVLRLAKPPIAVVAAIFTVHVLSSCVHAGLQESAELTSAAVAQPPRWPVSFVRKDSPACPGTEGGQMWYAHLRGTNAIRVTYGVRFNGTDDGRRQKFTLVPSVVEEYRLFCAGDRRTMAAEPFVVAVDYLN
jgi:hypothetical protein